MKARLKHLWEEWVLPGLVAVVLGTMAVLMVALMMVVAVLPYIILAAAIMLLFKCIF